VFQWNLIEGYAYFGGELHSPAFSRGITLSFDGAQNVKILNNWFKDNYLGGIAFGEDPDASRIGSGAMIINNIISGINSSSVTDTTTLTAVRGIRMTIDNADPVDFDALISGNVFYNNGNANGNNNNGAYCLYLGNNADVIIGTVENNIFYNNTNKGDLRLKTDDGNGYTITVTLDNNLYYRPAGDYILVGQGPLSSKLDEYPSTRSFADFKNGIGDADEPNAAESNWDEITRTGGSNELNSDPYFVSATNFNLQNKSPCINAGTDPFSDGDGDQYDMKDRLVWSDVTDAPVGPWADGVDIGAYGDNTGPAIGM